MGWAGVGFHGVAVVIKGGGPGLGFLVVLTGCVALNIFAHDRCSAWFPSQVLLSTPMERLAPIDSGFFGVVSAAVFVAFFLWGRFCDL